MKKIVLNLDDKTYSLLGQLSQEKFLSRGEIVNKFIEHELATKKQKTRIPGRWQQDHA